MSWTIARDSGAAVTGGRPLRLNVIGLGPAGAILALRAAARGWDVHAFDPAAQPDKGDDPLPDWPATYGAFAPEIPAWADDFFAHPETIRVTPMPGSPRTVGFGYRMMAKERLRAAVAECAQTATLRLHRAGLTEAGLAALPGATVDCRGAVVNGSALWQVAVGYVLSPAGPGSSSPSSFQDAALPAALRTPTLMDWTPSPAAAADGAQPSFLYVQRLPEGWLAEETILATRRVPSEAEYHLLRERLEARVRALAGDDWQQRLQVVDEERVAIPMGTAAPRHGGRGSWRFGARDGFIHPATGYSVGTSLNEADPLLDRIASRPQGGPGRRIAARIADWPRRGSVELARVLRRVGSLLLAEAGTRAVQSFFDAFFSLPAEDQLAYLSGRSGIKTARTMWRLRKNTGWSHPVLLPLYRRPARYLHFGMQRS